MKKIAKNLIVAAIFISGVLTASPSAFGQFTADNLYFGFQNAAHSGKADYIINLGPAANIIGGSSVVDLSGDFSFNYFTNVLGSAPSMFGGVVGGKQSSTAEVYVTQLRASGAGNPAVPGSTLTAAFTRSDDNNAITKLSTLNVSLTSGVGILDTNKTWESDVEPTTASSSFYGQTGINPDSSVGKTSVLYEDLWYTSNGAISGTQPFTYLGYFTLDLSGSTPKLTFTPTNAPVVLATRPVILSVTKIGNTVTLISSNAVPSHSYQLQYTASLSPTNWMNVGSAVTANTTMVTNTDATATAAQRFYQVQAQ